MGGARRCASASFSWDCDGWGHQDLVDFVIWPEANQQIAIAGLRDGGLGVQKINVLMRPQRARDPVERNERIANLNARITAAVSIGDLFHQRGHLNDAPRN